MDTNPSLPQPHRNHESAVRPMTNNKAIDTNEQLEKIKDLALTNPTVAGCLRLIIQPQSTVKLTDALMYAIRLLAEENKHLSDEVMRLTANQTRPFIR